MRHPHVATSDQIASHQHFTLLELLDRLLDKGVMAKGEIVLSVAEIDLVYLNLGLLLSSVKTVEQAAGKGSLRGPQRPLRSTQQAEALDHRQPEPAAISRQAARVSEPREPTPALSSLLDHGLGPLRQPGAAIDSAEVEKGLARLIVTLVDLIRKLMEKQALRRIEAGQLQVDEIERVGTAFFLLDEQIEQIKATFGLKNEDLNIDLGPLGELLGQG
jgi:hypothetical protein